MVTNKGMGRALAHTRRVGTWERSGHAVVLLVDRNKWGGGTIRRLVWSGAGEICSQWVPQICLYGGGRLCALLRCANVEPFIS